MLINPRPIKIKPTPIQKSARRSSFPFFPISRRKEPKPTSKGAKNSGLNTLRAALDTCVRDTIQAVMVVPMFAPMINPTDWERFRIPALTKPTTMTVVAEEDCTRAVMPAPRRTAISRFPVTIFKNFDIFELAAFCIPSLITVMPYRNIPNPPNRVNKLER